MSGERRPSPAEPRANSAPNPLVRWWESRTTVAQLVISFPVFAMLMFLINVGPFNQPLIRSILYGLFEGGVLSGLLAVATATERGKRA